VAEGTDRAHVRLAELVAALSLGVDLGFGQPMEHMLRQCLIALRLADGVGLDEQGRANVYYTALLVGVGCHSDAHEQAKWFGDDIALKSGKYDHEFRSLRAAAAGIRRLGSGHAGSHRFRVALEFALSGHREVAEMITQHAAMTRSLGEQLGLQNQVLDALPDQRRQQRVGTITTADGTEIFFKDWGSGQPIVFSHGWPLSGDGWDTQMLFFLRHGYRVIAHDRRGHGRSTQTSDGHDMDHYADDLAALTAHLDLDGAIHVGHSTGGGEVVHYVA
jgi:hypothetical protein